MEGKRRILDPKDLATVYSFGWQETITGKTEGTFLWQPFRRKNGGFLPSTPTSFFAQRPRHLCLFTPFLSMFDCTARAEVAVQFATIHACHPCHG